MSSVSEKLRLLQEKLEDLQRDTKFCVNNYDYHHKNNEHEIILNIEGLLKDSLKEGQEYLNNVKNVRVLIDNARQKCLEVDKLLNDMGVHDKSKGTEKCSAGSESFAEQPDLEDAEENKEN